MKKYLFVFCLTNLLLCNISFAGSLSGDDKKTHMAASYGIYLTSAWVLEKKTEWPFWQRTLVSSLGTLAIGLLKEAIDDEGDSDDMLANTVGVALGVGVNFVVHEF